MAFDPKVGEGAFKKLEATLRALPADAIATPNCDVQDGAVGALALVDLANHPTRKALFELLHEQLFAKDTVEKLETSAWAAWYAHTRVLSEMAGASGMRVDATMYQESGKLLRDLLQLIEYHVGKVPEVAVEIADIRTGLGYQDRASDLARVAALWDEWERELRDDKRLYREHDSAKARDYAHQIVTALRAHTPDATAAWLDLRNRAWTLMSSLYTDVQAAGVFVFRHQPESAAQFVALRQAVVHRRRRTTAGPSPAEPPPPEPSPSAATAPAE